MKKTLMLMTMAALLFLCSTPLTAQEFNNLAPTPPMGWNTWNRFACNVSETLIKQAADAMVSSGMKDAGYQYIVIDDCWQKSRDAQGFIQPDPERFPNGIKPVADYVHSKGLKFGIYTDVGTKTCGGKPGSRGHEYQDAISYASWGVDYVKADWCNTVPNQNAEASYTTLRDALKQSGRPIVLSLCEWGDNKPWLWGEKAGGNLWRTTGDIRDQWSGNAKWPGGACCSWGFTEIVDKQEGIEDASGPGHWNDPDMLEVGNGGLTDVEARSHFSLWAMLAAPLIAGNDLANMSPETREILTNKEVIAVDQDTLGKQGRRIWRQERLEIYARPLADGSMAVILFNRSDKEAPITVDWSTLGLDWNANMQVRDLWQHKDLGSFLHKFTANVVSHGVVMIRIKK
jgi:alpha-galactosidase